MTTTTDRIALLLDVLGHEDTELTGQPRLWRHRDGRYLTDDEVAMVAECTVGDIRRAMDLWHEEIEHMQEQDQLRAEFLAILGRFSVSSAEPIQEIVRRLPQAEKKRAEEIWPRIGPSFEAWRLEQS
jgi:hypothetical protein